MLGWFFDRKARKPLPTKSTMESNGRSGKQVTPDSKRDRQLGSGGGKSRRSTALPSAVLAIVFLALVAIAVAGIWLRHDDALRDGRREAENLAGILSQHLALQIASIEETLREVAAHNRYVGGPDTAGDEWVRLLSIVAAGRFGVEALLVTDADGRTTFSSLPYLIGESRADGRAFRELSANPKSDALIAEDPVRSINDRKFVVPFARVLRTPNSEFQGLAMATLQPDLFRQFYATVDVGKNGIVWLLKAPDQVLLRVPPETDPADQPWPAILPAGTAGERGITTGPLESGGADYLTAYRTLENTGLTVAVSLAAGDRLAPWWNEVYAVAALMVVAAMLFLVAAIVMSRIDRRRAT